MTDSVLHLVALFLGLAAAFSWVNIRFFNLPTGIALMAMGLATAILVWGIDALAPNLGLAGAVETRIDVVDFSGVLLEFVLAYILFAGGMTVDFASFTREWKGVTALAILGTLISVAIIAVSIWLVSGWLGHALPFAWALVFATLISPTDPVAVLSSLRHTKVPTRTRTLLQGEALFNDGLAIVLFLAATRLASGDTSVNLPQVGALVLWEAIGGALVGWVGGRVAVRAMYQIDDYAVEVLITIAFATGIFAIANVMHMSGPIAAAVVGLQVGSPHGDQAMSETTQRYLRGFWDVFDELLNSLIFLLIGLEAIVLHFESNMVGLAIAAVVIALLARAAAVAAPGAMLRALGTEMPTKEMTVLFWGGVRGAVSLALALSIAGPHRDTIIVSAYAVVTFSIFVQGLTLPTIARRSGLAETEPTG